MDFFEEFYKSLENYYEIKEYEEGFIIFNNIFITKIST